MKHSCSAERALSWEAGPRRESCAHPFGQRPLHLSRARCVGSLLREAGVRQLAGRAALQPRHADVNDGASRPWPA
eukprot:5499992-Alexandrium_andersonii.AAC.1